MKRIYERASASEGLRRSDLAVSFADATRDDLPLSYVNDAFCALTGYDESECLGLNCRFLQGESTDVEAVRRVRDGIRRRIYRVTPLTNYRKSGEAFTNALLVGPVRDRAGAVRRLFGMQWDIDATQRRRQEHLGRSWYEDEQPRQIAKFETLVDITARAALESGNGALGIPMVERMIALSRPQQYPPDERLTNWSRADALLEYLAQPYELLQKEQLNVDDDIGFVAADATAPLALVVHELVRGADRLAGAAAARPRVSLGCGVHMEDKEPVFELRWQAEVTAPGNDADLRTLAETVSDGERIIARVLERVGGRVTFEREEGRLSATAVVPNRSYAFDAPASASPSA